MKKILAKFKISRALDAGEPVPAQLRRQANATSEVGDFLERAETVDRMLKRDRAQVAAPATLHNSIMRAVAQARQSQPDPQPFMARWLPTALGATAVLLLLGVFLSVRLKQQGEQAAQAQSLSVATEALQKGNEFARAIPSKMIAPVSGELDRLNQDVGTTAKFVLASIP